MTEVPSRFWSGLAFIAGTTFAIWVVGLLVAGPAHASHCTHDSPSLDTQCEDAHVVVDNWPDPLNVWETNPDEIGDGGGTASDDTPWPPDPLVCPESTEEAAATWDYAYEPSASAWARDPDCVLYVYDPSVVDVLASNRVILTVGFATLAVPIYGFFVLAIVRR